MSEDFDIREETLSNAERDFENALRPLKFSDFNGQKKVVENLESHSTIPSFMGHLAWEKPR